jgi:hypothetical protein
MEFEHFKLSGVVLYAVCKTGVYLSTATLDKTHRILQIHPDNAIFLAEGDFRRIQLLRIDNQTGLIIYGGDANFPNYVEFVFQTFQLANTGEFNEGNNFLAE